MSSTLAKCSLAEAAACSPSRSSSILARPSCTFSQISALKTAIRKLNSRLNSLRTRPHSERTARRWKKASIIVSSMAMVRDISMDSFQTSRSALLTQPRHLASTMSRFCRLIKLQEFLRTNLPVSSAYLLNRVRDKSKRS